MSADPPTPPPAGAAGPTGPAGPEPLPEGIRRGIELFNEGAYYEAHEVMEDAWRATPGDERVCYQGLIQVAVALWRVTRGDAAIALTMCSRALPKLVLFRPHFAGIDVESLFHDVEWVRDQVIALGQDRLKTGFDPTQYPRIKKVAPR